MGAEELSIFRIQNEIRSLKLKTKTLEQVTIRERLSKLAKTNPNMAEDLENQFINVLSRLKDDKVNSTKQTFKKKW